MAFNLGVISLLVNDCFVLDINIKPEIFCCREAELIDHEYISLANFINHADILFYNM